ncbi:Bacterial Ig-like domain (group 2) [uncultured Clostridium sp.]|nr:Bacterial Ig-like domain (group 2) [uncultured Clostridium sp.]
MNIGDTAKLIATVGPEDATDKTVIFESSNENVAIVDNNGNVKAVGIGTAVITARSGSEEATCTVTVKLPLVQMNNVPEINAEDVNIKLGDTFDPKDYVKANDKEDGDLTEKIEVIENTVDTKTAGEYKVVYKVTDLDGASFTKEIKVTVNEKLQLPEIPEVDPEEPELPSDPEIPVEPEVPGESDTPEIPSKPESSQVPNDNQSSSDDKNDSNMESTVLPQTGDNSILGLIALVVLSSAVLYI